MENLELFDSQYVFKEVDVCVVDAVVSPMLAADWGVTLPDLYEGGIVMIPVTCSPLSVPA